jgi:tetratricopeptide (TPR) repeat protein
MVRPFVVQETYGVHCHVLPNGMSVNIGAFGGEVVPPIVHGAVLLSASELNGALWPSRELNPYRAFQTRKPDEEIDCSVLVYRGDVHMEAASGTGRAFLAESKLRAKQPQQALPLAEEGVRLAPDNLYTQWALGDVAAALGKKQEARAGYEAAIAAANRLDAGRRAEYVKYIQESLKKLRE